MALNSCSSRLCLFSETRSCKTATVLFPSRRASSSSSLESAGGRLSCRFAAVAIFTPLRAKSYHAGLHASTWTSWDRRLSRPAFCGLAERSFELPLETQKRCLPLKPPTHLLRSRVHLRPTPGSPFERIESSIGHSNTFDGSSKSTRARQYSIRIDRYRVRQLFIRGNAFLFH